MSSLKIEDNRATVIGSLDRRLNFLIPDLEGGKKWLRGGGFSFEATPLNLEHFRKTFPEVVVSDLRAKIDFGPSRMLPLKRKTPYQAKKDYDHQRRAKEQFLSLKVCALFAEMGTGKSKVAVDKGGEHFCNGEITAFLIVCKKGPHEQWETQHIPEWLDETIPREVYTWDKQQALPKDFLTPSPKKLYFFSINVDALKTPKGFAVAADFIELHEGRVMMIVDESQTIKNYRALRTKACYALGAQCKYRMIMTGTPIAKDLTDEWAQFKFLDEAIIGHRYLTSFRAEYCRMGGFQQRTVIGHKNLERFNARVAPFIFRVTKEEELDLPPKVFTIEKFSMTDDQKRMYNSMRDNFITAFDGGTISSVAIAATMILRLQQITCGYLPDDDGNIQLIDNPRLAALLEVIEQRPGKRIIWARFREDIKQIEAALKKSGRKCVTLSGSTKTKERGASVARWMDPDSGIDDLVSNPAVGGTGWNLQGDCRTAIYYSNSFNAIERWQSEDRIHRIGMKGTVTYIDLICSGSVDRKILRNLKAKKSLSDFVLDDIRKLLVEDEPKKKTAADIEFDAEIERALEWDRENQK